MSRKGICLLVVAFFSGALLVLVVPHGGSSASHAAVASQPAQNDQIVALRGEVERLKAMINDQSHVMADVEYHYCNLWFAGQSENWALAQFYADETRSHLRWAVRVIPVRKDRQGRDVDLDGILTALEQTSLKDLDEAVKAKDKARFTQAYKTQLRNCVACHEASSKEFIQLRVPERADAGMIDFGGSQGGK